MGGRNSLHRTQPKLKKLADLQTCLQAFRLVGDQQAGLAQASQVVGNVMVLARDTVTRIYQKQNHIRLGHRLAGLFGHFTVNPATRIGLKTAGVDDDKVLLVQPRIAVMAVTGEPGIVGHDGIAAFGESIKQGRLAHIGSPDQGKNRFHWLGRPA